MTSREVEIEFNDTDDFPSPPPLYLRQLAFHPNLCRALWQNDYEAESDSGYSSDDEELNVIKEEEELPNVYCNLQNPESVADGICGECKLSGKIEESPQPETVGCSQ
jgi:hypothetical protein